MTSSSPAENPGGSDCVSGLQNGSSKAMTISSPDENSTGSEKKLIYKLPLTEMQYLSTEPRDALFWPTFSENCMKIF